MIVVDAKISIDSNECTLNKAIIVIIEQEKKRLTNNKTENCPNSDIYIEFSVIGIMGGKIHFISFF